MDPVSMIVLFTVLTLLITIGIITFFIAKRRSDANNRLIKLKEFKSEDDEESLQHKKTPSPFNQLVWRVLKGLFATHSIVFPAKNSVERAELKEDVLKLIDKNAIVLQPADLSEQTFRHIPKGVSFKGVLTVGAKIESLTAEEDIMEEDIMKVPDSDDSTNDDNQTKRLEITVKTVAEPK